jgi:hypothetical protein
MKKIAIKKLKSLLNVDMRDHISNSLNFEKSIQFNRISRVLPSIMTLRESKENIPFDLYAHIIEG